MHADYTGEITLADLCPGAHDHGDEHDHVDDFTSTLNSEQNVPHSDSLSTGTAILEFNEDFTELSYEIILSGLDLDHNQTTGDECTYSY